MSPTSSREALGKTIEVRLLAWIMSREAARSLDETFTDAGIDVNGLQYGMLRLLRYETATLSDLSRKFMLDPSTLVPVIDDLVKKGYVKRQRDPKDRRRAPLIITDKGRTLITRMPTQSPKTDRFTTLMLALGDDKVSQLYDLLRDFVLLLPDGDAMLQHVRDRREALLNAHHEESPVDDIGC